MEETNEETKRSVITNWLESDSDADNAAQAFDKTEFEGTKGHLRLHMQKTYGGDSRFKLTSDFVIEKKIDMLP